jgi:hypothetical protein
MQVSEPVWREVLLGLSGAVIHGLSLVDRFYSVMRRVSRLVDINGSRFGRIGQLSILRRWLRSPPICGQCWLETTS